MEFSRLKSVLFKILKFDLICKKHIELTAFKQLFTWLPLNAIYDFQERATKVNFNL